MIEVIKEHWAIINPILTVGAPLIIILLATKFVQRKEFEILITDVSKLKKEMASAQRKIEELPTKSEIHKLNLEIAGLRGDIKSIEPKLRGVQHISELLLETKIKDGK